MTRRIIYGAALMLSLLAALPSRSQDRPAAPPARPSVIFFIGDGMGLSQVTLGRMAAQARGERYHLDRFRTLGLSSCRSANWLVTDSAAAATALASGVKTNNQVVGLLPDETTPTPTLVEVAHREGLATGVVTTTRITHATPAGFLAHVRHRDLEDEIAAQIVSDTLAGYPDVLIGGGRRFFKEPALAAMRGAGYQVVLEPADLAAARGPRLAALMNDSHLPYSIERPAGEPTLADLTAKAVELLSAKGPFFLMVEGGRIDHACHEHDAPSCIFDQLDLDRAVGWALDLAERRGDVLVVVTADHATGDLGIAETVKLDRLMAVRSSAELLTRRSVDVGEAEQALAFTDRVKEATGVALTPDEVRAIWAHGPEDKYWARTKLGHLVSSRFGVEFYPAELQEAEHVNTHGHDGAMVGVWAFGPGAERFAGTYENTELPRRIARVQRLPLPGVEATVAPGSPRGRRF